MPDGSKRPRYTQLRRPAWLTHATHERTDRTTSPPLEGTRCFSALTLAPAAPAPS